MLELTMTQSQKAIEAARRVGQPGEPSLQAMAKLYGISTGIISDARTILSKATPEEIAAIVNGTASVTITARNVRHRFNPRPMPSKRYRLMVKNGDVPSVAARKGIDLQKRGLLPTEAAKTIGMAPHAYTIVRDIVLLQDRNDLTSQEVALVADALADIDNARGLTHVWQRVKPLALRVWGAKGVRLKSDIKRDQQFKNAISLLETACESGLSMEIPHLGAEQIDEACRRITFAMAALRKLKGRIRRSQYD